MGRQNVQCDTMTQAAVASVGTSAALAADINGSRVICRILNTHGSQVLYIGTTSSVTSSIYSWSLAAGASVELDGYCGALYVIGSGASTTYKLLEGYTHTPAS